MLATPGSPPRLKLRPVVFPALEGALERPSAAEAVPVLAVA